jgi:hypothetical protein
MTPKVRTGVATGIMTRQIAVSQRLLGDVRFGRGNRGSLLGTGRG